MKIVPLDEVEGLEFFYNYRVGNRIVSPFVLMLRKLKVGEALIIERSEWKLKSKPSTRANAAWRDGSVQKGYKFIGRTLKNKDYCIIRVE